MAVLAMSLEGQIPSLDINRTVRVALVHDIGEALIGDITPHCGVSEEDKQNLEAEAVQKISSFVPAISDEINALWWEYEKRETLSAKVVFHLDKFDMVAQADAYERKYGIDLDQFFTSTKGCFSLEPFTAWDKELREKRNVRRENDQNKDKDNDDKI
ncbi:hypothetical protein WR25_21768 [Diploscapter pachys]|uniref:HD domain-containing protein n=1 Tax=Diploscapter pachys TaxID=2018661 RepID=A0A2A2LFN6_9BILA|nr:hypothetical protein WR25_21768 [Diploscapter pachys]